MPDRLLVENYSSVVASTWYRLQFPTPLGMIGPNGRSGAIGPMSTHDEPDSEPAEAAAEDTVLTDVLGDHPKVKILVALLGESDHDRNPTEIAHLAGIDRSTFYDHVDDLLAYGIVERTRTVGNSPMYRIGRENAAAEDLAALEWDLLDQVPDASG